MGGQGPPGIGRTYAGQYMRVVGDVVVVIEINEPIPISGSVDDERRQHEQQTNYQIGKPGAHTWHDSSWRREQAHSRVPSLGKRAEATRTAAGGTRNVPATVAGFGWRSAMPSGEVERNHQPTLEWPWGKKN